MWGWLWAVVVWLLRAGRRQLFRRVLLGCVVGLDVPYSVVVVKVNLGESGWAVQRVIARVDQAELDDGEIGSGGDPDRLSPHAVVEVGGQQGCESIPPAVWYSIGEGETQIGRETAGETIGVTRGLEVVERVGGVLGQSSVCRVGSMCRRGGDEQVFGELCTGSGSMSRSDML